MRGHNVRSVDAALSYLETKELGALEQSIALKGKLALPSGGRAPALLCRTRNGLYLLAAKNADNGTLVDLLERDDVRYERGAIGDRLRLRDVELHVPASQRRETRLAIALGRLRGKNPRAEQMIRAGRHVTPLGAIERAFLDGFVQTDEIVLSWLRMDTDAPVESKIASGSTGTAYFFMSPSRAARVVLSALGDVRVESLDGVKFTLDDSLTSTDLLAGRLRFRLQRSEIEHWREIVEALDLPPAGRIRAIARANFLGRADPEALAFSRALLDRGTRDGDPLATALGFMVSCDLGEPNPAAPDIDGAVGALATHHVPADALGKIWDDWRFSPEAAMVLLDQLRRHGDVAEPWALSLHERLHARLRAVRRDPKRIARADVELAEHLIHSGNRERARALLETRLAELPNEELLDLLPKDDADLTAGAGGQVIKIRVYELLAEARKTGEGLDRRALGELARLEPLVKTRVEAVAASAEASLGERARSVLGVLDAGGLTRADTQNPAISLPNPLAPELVRDLLPHPVAREGSALVGKIQTLLGAVPAPDHRLLLEYVEPISVARQPEAARALAAAARMLGSEGVQGFVSRGKKGIGFRAYDGPPPFVLVGGRHLDEDSEFGMSADELAFAIATEVAHLSYGHARVTSNEVWSGLFEKSKQGLDFLLDVLPLFKGVKIAERAYQILNRVPQPAIKRLLGGARAVQRRISSRSEVPAEHQSDDVLSAMHEALVAAARVMQLTADRAGLILTGNLNAALRSMMLVRPDHQDELERADRMGLSAFLSERTGDGQMRHQDLAVRVAALLSFYLSEDYARLRSAISS